MTNKAVAFPKGFLWGAATSSYQIEGAYQADGRGESIWDRFCRTPGKVLNGETGDVACDHYYRYKEDVGILKTLGVSAYRFSIAWPRIFPLGTGAVEPKGLDFYDRLVDSLLAAGIDPWPTLYHWDLPQALEDRGGWPARHTAELFVDYADVVTRRLGDRVHHWMTFNEPWVAAFLGYEFGIHAPGVQDPRKGVLASHHLLLAHGWSVPVIRRNSPGAEVGIVLNTSPTVPASPSAADYAAMTYQDGFVQRWFLDPLYGRGYPADMVAIWAERGHLDANLPFVQPGDMAVIAAHTDFLGVNYYARHIARSASVPQAKNLPRTVIPNAEHTANGWEVHAPALYDLLVRVGLDYQPQAIYITENGASYPDGPGPDGKVHDAQRLSYLERHLAETNRAIQAGVPVAGYFVWSLIDNFEWSMGYSQRFGIVWVDFATQQRILKDSALWYKRAVANNGFTISG